MKVYARPSAGHLLTSLVRFHSNGEGLLGWSVLGMGIHPVVRGVQHWLIIRGTMLEVKATEAIVGQTVRYRLNRNSLQGQLTVLYSVKSIMK